MVEAELALVSSHSGCNDLEFISLTATRALLLKEGNIKDDLQMTEQNNFKIVKSFMMEEGGE